MDRKMKWQINILMLMLVLLSGSVLAADLVDSDAHDYSVNEFLGSSSNMLGLLIPAILLVVTIVTFAIDFGTVGVSAAAAASLVILFFLQIVYLNPVSLISFIIIVAIMIYKMQG